LLAFSSVICSLGQTILVQRRFSIIISFRITGTALTGTRTLEFFWSHDLCKSFSWSQGIRTIVLIMHKESSSKTRSISARLHNATSQRTLSHVLIGQPLRSQLGLLHFPLVLSKRQTGKPEFHWQSNATSFPSLAQLQFK
jgi:hypothetical protein